MQEVIETFTSTSECLKSLYGNIKLKHFHLDIFSTNNHNFFHYVSAGVQSGQINEPVRGRQISK